MKTDYIALCTAINAIEDWGKELFTTYLKDNSFSKSSGKIRIPPLTNLFFYIRERRIDLYGQKYKENELLKISPHVIGCLSYEKEYDIFDYSLIRKFCIRSSYDYMDRYNPDFNYACLVDIFTNNILYTNLSVKYDEFLELITELNKKKIEELITELNKKKIEELITELNKKKIEEL